MQIQVVTEEGRQVVDPFLVRLGGWTEERYWAEAGDAILEAHAIRVGLNDDQHVNVRLRRGLTPRL